MRFRLLKPKTASPSRMDLIATKVAKGILYVQRHWADSMSKLANKASIKTQWAIFILFLIVSVCNCSWLLYQAYTKQPSSNIRNKMDRPILIKPTLPSDTVHQIKGTNSSKEDTLHHQMKTIPK